MLANNTAIEVVADRIKSWLRPGLDSRYVARAVIAAYESAMDKTENFTELTDNATLIAAAITAYKAALATTDLKIVPHEPNRAIIDAGLCRLKYGDGPTFSSDPVAALSRAWCAMWEAA